MMAVERPLNSGPYKMPEGNNYYVCRICPLINIPGYTVSGTKCTTSSIIERCNNMYSDGSFPRPSYKTGGETYKWKLRSGSNDLDTP